MPNDDIKQVFRIEVDGEGKLVSYKNELVKTEKAGEDLEKSNKGLTSSFGKLAGGVLTTAAAIKSAKLAWQLADLGARALTVDKNFEKFAQKGGKSAIGMMDDLRKASGGLMDDMFLQQQAMKAMISGVDFDDAIVAMEFVRNYALATGDDMNSKMQTVMTGLARGSAQFLDDVGIQVMGSSDVVGDAIAQMKEKMGDFADTTGDTSTAIAAMKSDFQNLKQEVGVGLVPVMDLLIDRFDEVGSDEIAGKIVSVTKHLSSFVTGVAGGMDAIFSGISISLLEVSSLATKAFSLVNKFNPLLHKQAKAAVTLSEALSQQADEEKELLKDRIAGYGDLITNLHKTAIVAESAGSAIGSSGSSSTLTGNIEDATSAIKEYSRANDLMLKHIMDTSEVDQNLSLPVGGLGVDESGQEESISKLSEFMGTYAEVAQQGVNAVGSIFSSVYSNQRMEIDALAKAEKDAVNSSTMSAKRKAKEITKIEEKARKDRHEAELKQWRVNILMSIGNTALGVTTALATQNYPGAIITGVLGDAATGVIIANKPKYYYGSRNGAGAYSEIGGNSQGDQIDARITSGELIVKAGEDAKFAKNALNNRGSTTSNNTSSQQINFAPVFNVTESSGVSTVAEIQSILVDTIQNAPFNGMFNPAVSNVF